MKFKKPLDYCVVTQPFGVNYVDFYQKLGLNGHNGVDLRVSENNAYASFDGFVFFAGKYNDGGVGVEIISDHIENNKFRYKLLYYHLKKVDSNVNTGDRVKAGQVIGITDNTGLMTTGNHLHFGLKKVKVYNPHETIDYNNGYHGSVDPVSFMEENWDKLPVDLYYGLERNWYAEWMLRFKNAWVHRRLISVYHRSPLSLNSREVNAIVYGGWGFDESLNPSMYPIWALLKKDEWLKIKKVPFHI